MASIPARQQSQPRRPSADHASSQSQAAPSPVQVRSPTLDDSQTLFLSSPPKEEPTPQETQSDQQQSPTSTPAPPQSGDDDPSVKKCWICFADSTEDTRETSPWRDPCPCALVAHEECLLDWIADMEAPKNSRNRSIGAPKIECPQCKSEIKLARPRNYLVEAVRATERLAAKSITPGALSVLGGVLYSSSMAWGVHSVYAVFGAEDGFRILRPMVLNATRPPIETCAGEDFNEISRKMLGVLVDHLVHWRLYLGLPLITPVLILSRTSFADQILPVLPIFFFATQTHSPDDAALDFAHWPPSASLAFAVLPYVRSAYNVYYQKVWAEKERRWLKEIQPRSGQGQNDADGGDENRDIDPAMQDGRDDDNVFEVRIDGGIWEEWEEDPGAPAPEIPQRNDPNIAAERDHAHAEPPPNIADHRAAQQAANVPPAHAQPNPDPAQNDNGGERRLSFSPTAIAETILGAILFPTVCGLSGELLKLALPKSWTTPGSQLGNRGLQRVPAKGLLQEKWGRSLVGGCLFVVCKDALMLYVRWKMVQMHRGRRVLDYERKRG